MFKEDQMDKVKKGKEVWQRELQMLANPAEQASAIVYLVLSMIAGFLLVELGLWLGGRLMRSHMEAAGAREEL